MVKCCVLHWMLWCVACNVDVMLAWVLRCLACGEVLCLALVAIVFGLRCRCDASLGATLLGTW